jgi:hypothetical protein
VGDLFLPSDPDVDGWERMESRGVASWSNGCVLWFRGLHALLLQENEDALKPIIVVNRLLSTFLKKFVLCLVVACLILATVSWCYAFALQEAINAGTQWLISQQRGDGSWNKAIDPLETATAPLVTETAIETLRILNTGANQINNAVGYLNTFPAFDHDSSARIALATSNNTQGQSLLNTLNPDGGWGITPDFASDPLTTVIVLKSLQGLALGGTSKVAATDYLVGKQNIDGSWSYSIEATPQLMSSVNLTALVLSVLQREGRTTALTTALSKGVAYLKGQQQAGGSWGSVFETALAYLALVGLTTDATVLGGAGNSLLATQLADGSWDQDPYSTALALRAHIYS